MEHQGRENGTYLTEEAICISGPTILPALAGYYGLEVIHVVL